MGASDHKEYQVYWKKIGSGASPIPLNNFMYIGPCNNEEFTPPRAVPELVMYAVDEPQICPESFLPFLCFADI